VELSATWAWATSRIPHFLVTVFPVKQYREAQLKIILNIYNKDTTYTGVGETDNF